MGKQWFSKACTASFQDGRHKYQKKLWDWAQIRLNIVFIYGNVEFVTGPILLKKMGPDLQNCVHISTTSKVHSCSEQGQKMLILIKVGLFLTYKPFFPKLLSRRVVLPSAAQDYSFSCAKLNVNSSKSPPTHGQSHCKSCFIQTKLIKAKCSHLLINQTKYI